MRRGFTLIEMVIVAAVFSVVFLVATTVWSNSFRQHRQIQLSQRVTSDERTLLETVARSIRTGTVNYARYESGEVGATRHCDAYAFAQSGDASCSLQSATPILSIMPSDGTGEVCFRQDPATKTLQLSTSDCFFGATPPVVISPADIVVDDFHIFVTPRSDPFADPTDTSRTITCPNSASSASTFHNSTCDANPLSMDRWCCPDDATTCHPEVHIIFGTGKCLVANTQPTVTIYMTTHSASGSQNSSSTVQTTITTRAYRR